MAKRSTRRERDRAAHAAPAPEPQEAAPSYRQFWLGALVAACLLIPVGVVGIVIASGSSDEEPATVSAEVTPAPTVDERTEAERLQELSQTRDKGQVQELTDLARQYSEQLDPVVAGLDKSFPIGEPDKLGPLASESDVEEWVRTSREIAAYFDETVSGETGTNIARGALATAVRGIAAAAETYQLALREPALRDELLEAARRQRDNAIKAWETANVQIDVINIAVGYGHQHPAIPGSGGAAPDSLPEGTDAEEG